MAVKVYERILQLFEAEGINTLFGIPDPNFVHMFLEAEKRGWKVVAPHHEAAAGFMAEAASPHDRQAGCVHRHARPWHRQCGAAPCMCAKVENSPVIFLGGQRARVTEQRVRRGRIQFVKQDAAVREFGEVRRLDRICRPDRRDHSPGDAQLACPARPVRSTSNIRRT